MNSLDSATQPSDWPVVGHDKAISVLRRSLGSGRLAHAYLFTGPEGIGKRTLALAFAMALNCLAAPPPGQEYPDVPCGLCSSCSRIRHGSHPDLFEMSLETQAAMDSGKSKGAPAKEIRIDAIRELQAGVGLAPYSGRWKVYIIGDADRMNEEAANCLLKTLEEPPGHTILILLADDESSVLPTISSRCLQIPLRPLRRSLVRDSLVRHWGADPSQAETLAALSGGRLGYAVRLLGDNAALNRRRSALEDLALLSGAPISQRIEAATRYAKRFTDARPEVYSLLDAWESWWRDVLLVGASAPELAGNVDQVHGLNSFARRTSPVRASLAIELVQQTRKQLLENVNPRLALEALTLGIP